MDKLLVAAGGRSGPRKSLNLHPARSDDYPVPIPAGWIRQFNYWPSGNVPSLWRVFVAS